MSANSGDSEINVPRGTLKPLKDRLHDLRHSLKLRQKEMAERLQVGYGTYRSWEYGKKTPKKMALMELERRIQAL